MARPALGWQVNPLVFHLIYHTESFRTRLIFCFWLRGAGLISFCHLVEGGFDADGGARTRFQLDRSLLSALVDGWRPETHTFHHPCGEMAPTLQDVAYLLGLPLVGPAVGPPWCRVHGWMIWRHVLPRCSESRLQGRSTRTSAEKWEALQGTGCYSSRYVM